jgi:hypothetical protein
MAQCKVFPIGCKKEVNDVRRDFEQICKSI